MADPYFRPGPEIARALAYAVDHHGAQTRKGTSIPYVHHLLGVASIALQFGADETETVAAILHDVLEDTPVCEEELRDEFGTDVTQLVVHCSAEEKVAGEDPAHTWEARKLAYVAQLADSPGSAVLISLADKIHNCRSMADDLRYIADTDSYWDRFNATGADQLWYYRSLLQMYERRVGDADGRITDRMVDELRCAIETMAASVPERSRVRT